MAALVARPAGWLATKICTHQTPVASSQGGRGHTRPAGDHTTTRGPRLHTAPMQRVVVELTVPGDLTWLCMGAMRRRACYDVSSRAPVANIESFDL